MKYAIISDIHGNLLALKAALDDARARGADAFLLLGDYCRGFPWPNEVVEVIRGLRNAVVIQGNNEGYLINMLAQDQSQWNYDQLKMIYWNFRVLTPENFTYLTELPETVDVSGHDGDIHLSHASKVFYRSPHIQYFTSSGFQEIMEQEPFTHDEYLARAREALLSRSDVLADICALPKGVYLFGHHHIQFQVEYAGRLFINPGSCGMSTDWDTAAPYTLLEYVKDRWVVTERRIAYDLNATAKALRTSELAACAPMWSRVIERQLMTGKDHFGSFAQHVIAMGRKFGHTHGPVSNELFAIAAKTWEE